MKKDVTINCHLDNVEEMSDLIRTELEDDKTYLPTWTPWLSGSDENERP